MCLLRAGVVVTVAAILLTPMTGCDSNPVSPDRSQYYVTYSLTITGNQSSITALTYKRDSRTVTVNNPTDGWSAEFWTYAGTTVGLTAQGTVRNGTIEIMWRGVHSQGRKEVFGVDSCTAQDSAQPCTLATAEYTL